MKKTLFIFIPILIMMLIFSLRPKLPNSITSRLVDDIKVVEKETITSFRDGGELYLHLEMSEENSIKQIKKLESFDQNTLRTKLIQEISDQVKETFDHDLIIHDNIPIYIYSDNNHRILYLIQSDKNKAILS